MVKNTSGGNKSKGFARKLTNNKSVQKLRVATDKLELYAQVTALLGNRMCRVLCQDNKTRLCHIRGRFSGRNKKDNALLVGGMVLIGLREWSEEKEKVQACDLLEVYNLADNSKLKSLVVSFSWNMFSSDVNNNTNIHEDDIVMFNDDGMDDLDKLIATAATATKATTVDASATVATVATVAIEGTIGAVEDELNFDDI